MGSEWKATTLGDVIELKRGYDLPAQLRTRGTVPVISSAGVSDYHSDSKVAGPGVVTGRYGTIGNVFFSTEAYWPLNTTLYVRDFKGNLPKFIYYFLKTLDFQEFSDKAAVPGVNRNHLHMANVHVPASVGEQHAIAHILGSLDDKIELNRRMNETLEGMAQALFKSWFVDFDPVIDNALVAGNSIPEELADRAEVRRAALANGTANREAAKPFPAAFQQTEELGWIPVGWEVSNVGKHVSLQRGTTYKSRLKGLPGPYLLGLGSIQRNGGFKENSLKTYGGDCPPKMVLKPGDIFVSLKDITQAADLLGSVARLPYHISSGRLTQDTVKLVFDGEPVSKDYIYNMLLTERYRDHCRSRATGTTNLGLAREDFFGFPFAMPSVEIQITYDRLVQSCNEKHQVNTAESISLTHIRDTLLPKLISGELRIPDAEKLAEAALA